jgi:hypothetical protein
MTKGQFFFECALLGLTYDEAETAEKICTALLIKYADMVHRLQNSPSMVANLKILAER